jgi:hypothetical protein
MSIIKTPTEITFEQREQKAMEEIQLLMKRYGVVINPKVTFEASGLGGLMLKAAGFDIICNERLKAQ